MKTILLSTLLFLSSNLFSQKEYTTYTNSFTIDEYSIGISGEDTTKYDLYIDCYSIDKLADKGGILLKSKQLESFTTALSNAKVKYEEWMKTAKENNVEELTKPMTYTAKAGGYFQYGDGWHFQFAVTLTFEFQVIKISEEVRYLMVVKTGKLQSSSNQFIDAKGFYILFSSAEEIDSFLSKLSEEKIKEFLKKPKTEDLFKD